MRKILTIQYPGSHISMKGLAKTKTLEDETEEIIEWKTFELAFVPILYGEQSNDRNAQEVTEE